VVCVGSLLGVALKRHGSSFPVGKVDFLTIHPVSFKEYLKAADPSFLQEQLAKENKKFKFALVEKNARARDYENAIEWLHLAGLVYKIYATETICLPLNAYREDTSFKLYLNDVGILRVLFRLDPSIVTDGDLLFREFKGILTENCILTSLIRQFGHEPVYWKSGRN
jgi:predicted AAA+ superfamily ATPase